MVEPIPVDDEGAQIPVLGRVVHYNADGEWCAALTVRSVPLVLVVFPPVEGPLAYVEDAAQGTEPGTWRWPPYS